jgi:hypothetical protein
MAQHARPHLQTHLRESKHSSVAGAAYRLGLKLFDERTETWHDYAHRAGKEVVFAKTIGPEGTPAWLLDPATLWNEVEKAEPRSNSQVARDYRIPVPLGLSKDEAIAMSMAMAGYLVARFNVPVSIGVHNDNDTDLDGNKKPPGMIGFHAHLYMPTRELTREGEGDNAVWRLGRKLSELSNKRTSSPLVDAMNAKWGQLANRFARAAGIQTQFESMSYERLGLDIKPKPTRARRFGKQNAWHPPGSNAPNVDMSPAAVTGRLHARRATHITKVLTTDASRARRRVARFQAGGPQGKAPLINRAGFVGGRTLRIDSNLRLAALMQRAGPKPTNDAEQAALERAMFLADFIESLLFAQERARQQAGDFDMKLLREEMALADGRARQKVVEAALRRAEDKLDQWLRTHPLRARLHVPFDEHGLLVTNRNTAAKDVVRVQNDLHRLTGVITTLSRERETEEARETKTRARIVNQMQGYRSEFKKVVQTISPALDDAQKVDIRALADTLEVDMPDIVSLARTESAFPAPRHSH